jgi:hypothetical protein
MVGAQLERVVAGEELLDLGPAPGTGALGPRVLGFERAIGYLTAAVQMTFRGGDPTEPYALARLACQVQGEPPYAAQLREVDRYIALAQERLNGAGEDDAYPAVHTAMTAMILAGTSAMTGRPAA